MASASASAVRPSATSYGQAAGIRLEEQIDGALARLMPDNIRFAVRHGQAFHTLTQVVAVPGIDLQLVASVDGTAGPEFRHRSHVAAFRYRHWNRSPRSPGSVWVRDLHRDRQFEVQQAAVVESWPPGRAFLPAGAGVVADQRDSDNVLLPGSPAVHEDEGPDPVAVGDGSSRRSTVAVSTLMPALNVFVDHPSPTAHFFSFVRTKAGTHPADCWNR